MYPINTCVGKMHALKNFIFVVLRVGKYILKNCVCVFLNAEVLHSVKVQSIIYKVLALKFKDINKTNSCNCIIFSFCHTLAQGNIKNLMKGKAAICAQEITFLIRGVVFFFVCWQRLSLEGTFLAYVQRKAASL